MIFHLPNSHLVRTVSVTLLAPPQTHEQVVVICTSTPSSLLHHVPADEDKNVLHVFNPDNRRCTTKIFPMRFEAVMAMKTLKFVFGLQRSTHL